MRRREFERVSCHYEYDDGGAPVEVVRWSVRPWRPFGVGLPGWAAVVVGILIVFAFLVTHR